MQEGLLPLFPLQLVLFPGEPLPLHIFEERYKEMIGECLAMDTEFGIVLARDKGLLRTGCTAIVRQVLKRYDDGRLDILVQGLRRFQIAEINDERNFLRASVHFMDDDDIAAAKDEDVRGAVAAYVEMSKSSDPEPVLPDESDPQLSFQLARVSDDLDFRQMILSLRSEAERIRLIASYLPKLRQQQLAHEAMRETARTNGHAKHRIVQPGQAE
jgi:Lon protease-like protein